MKTQTLKEQFRRLTLARRQHFALNNPRRTDYYLAFWQKHPEISWALLANMVSRNTGWFMSDSLRASRLAPHGMKLPGFPPAHYQAFFVFLEMGNFLIFRDVFPQMEAYDWAKRYPEHHEIFFALLKDDPQFDVDPFIVEHWQSFLKKARANQWFPYWWKEPDVQRQAFAQIANEQNQIHDRLLHDPKHTYLGLALSSINKQIFLASTALGLAKLCFPAAKSETNPDTDHLLIYTMSCDFNIYENRVNIGRDLYVGLFGEETRRQQVITWAKTNRRFRGTRVEYNPHRFSVRPRANKEQKYSPPLVFWQNQPPAWPIDATQMRFYGHLHDRPVPLPVTVRERGAMVENLLTPLDVPVHPLKLKTLTDSAETFLGNSSALQLSIILQRMMKKTARSRPALSRLA